MDSTAERQREGRIEATGFLILLAALGMMPPELELKWRLVPGVLASVLAAWLWRDKRQSPAFGLGLVVSGLCLAFAAGVSGQAALLTGLVLAALITRLSLPLLGFQWERGRVPVLGTLICAAVTPVGLSAWVYFMQPDLSDFAALIPEVSPWLLILGALAFAVANALLEECVWRGVMQGCLTRLWGVPVAIGIQGASFGLAHAHGFPHGVVGVLLAGAWALMLGALRHAAGGLLAPLIAHIVADTTIAVIVLSRLA